MPISAGIAAGAQAVGGLFQSIFSGRKRKERELEKYADTWRPSESILDLYNKAYSRYNPNAYQSKMYQEQQNQIQRNLATGIGASQDRRGGLANIAALTQGANDASRRAATAAEQMQGQQLSQLGQAAAQKAAQDRYGYEMKYNLLAAKAGQAARTQNMGLQNIYGGLTNLGTVLSGKKKGGANNKSTTPSIYDYSADYNDNQTLG